MNKDVFLVALAGLLHDLNHFSKQAGSSDDVDVVIKQIVPQKWVAGVNEAISSIKHASDLARGNQNEKITGETKQLLSIFDSVSLSGDKKDPTNYVPLTPLRVERSKNKANETSPIFPLKEKSKNPTEEYKKLYARFIEQVKPLKDAHSNGETDMTSYLNSLLKLMQRFCWAVPSPHYSRADVSIYDHSRVTAAIAVCRKKSEDSDSNEVAVLVSGDISGVQKFIYTITSKGAASGLRGRSMYLQLLTEVTARYVLNQLGLPMTNLIYAGGGHFYLLAPVGSESKLELADIRQYISRVLLHHHQGDLYLALAGDTVLTSTDFSGGKLSAKWDDLHKSLQKIKQRQFSELGNDLSMLFDPIGHGGNEEKLCVVCQREHSGTKIYDEVRKCPVCLGFEELGKDLRKAQYLVLDELKNLVGLSDKDSSAGKWSTILALFGYRAGLYKKKKEIDTKSNNTRRTLFALNDKALGKIKPSAKQSIGRHYLVNVTPTLSKKEYKEYKDEIDDLHRDSVKPFEVMAKQSTGIKRMGILRMDVDNLGKIFSQGLGESSTLSRIASLSFAISLFFEGWLETIAKDINEKHGDGKELIYSIYSGGDDLFFVGAWNLMPLLAERISTDLAKYTGYNPDIHISGGIVLTPQKYPLYQAAADAGSAESKAKAQRSDGKAKNALNFLGQTIPWKERIERVQFDEEDKIPLEKFAYVEWWQENLVELVEQKKCPARLLHLLNILYVEYNEEIKRQLDAGETIHPYWGAGQWHSAYSLARMAGQHKNIKDEIKKIQDELKLDNFNNIEWLGLAARWAELFVR